MIKDEISLYIDSEGLVSPAAPPPGEPGSNNGVLYTSEYIIALLRNGQAQESDILSYLNKLSACMRQPGLLGRHLGGIGDQEGPDDYIGLAAALFEIQRPEYSAINRTASAGARQLARSVVWYGFKHLGLMNNVSPGHFSWAALLGRQLQLTAAFMWAAGYPVGPLLRLYCAVSIFFSCRGMPANNTTPRFLSWLLVQIASSKSYMGYFASVVWYRRLNSVYAIGMKGPCLIYFQAGHPLSKYWKDKA